MFSSGDGGVGDGDPDPATQQCFTNDGRNLTRFIPGFPASCPLSVFIFLKNDVLENRNLTITQRTWRTYSVTAVGGTINVPETAVFFSGGGFSNLVRSRVQFLSNIA